MKILRWLLFPFTILYVFVTELRNFFFNLGVLPSKKFDVPVITVGNLSTGGTGKSPMVDLLLKLLSKKYKPASLSRGYGRKTKGYHKVEINTPVDQTGDEPLMLKMANPAVPVSVDENRVYGIEMLLKEHKDLNVIVLDDAFQHRYVKAGYNIVLTTWQQPFYSDYVLPAGNLRELRKNAARAQVVVVTKCPPLTKAQMEHARKQVSRYTGAYVFFAGLEYGQPIGLTVGNHIDLQQHSVLLVTGIAHAGHLLEHCRSRALAVEHLGYADHYVYKPADYTAIAQKFDSFAGHNKVILTTHKDAVKWQASLTDGNNPIGKLPVFYQPVQMAMQDDIRFNALIENYVESNQPNR